ncbi:SURP and G-patch domain-containing protein 2 isoform X2 [Ahaetulla prasina]|uniref:SURP and G-patch domain-containing protein 2 isoform X2 n=1 Tax=Ahaetulla prasina TaxID=499056 RepID=UPI00264746DB|nr:SURP and G-patch domain-containing protein 2 isoform X2 [Ahaetulla prasina]
MASQRLTRESFDAIMQAKAKRYLDRSDPIDEALHQLRVHSRPVTRTQYDEEEEEFQDGGKFMRGDWRKDTRNEYALPSYRSSSHVTEEEDYFPKTSTKLASRNYGQLSSYEQDYGNSSAVERDYAGPSSRDRDYDNAASRERKYSHTPVRDPSRRRETDYDSSELLGDFRSTRLLEDNYRTACAQSYDLEQGLETEGEFSSTLSAGRGRGLQGKHGMATRGLDRSKEELAAHLKKWATKALSPADDLLLNPLGLAKQRTIPSHPQQNQRPALASPKGLLLQEGTLKPTGYVRIKEPDLELLDSSDIFANFGVEIIKWAGFYEIKRDPEYAELFRVLFTLETETCAKMLASFKCLLKTEHQDFCMNSVKTLQHPALRTPKVDSQFLNLLLEKRVMVTKNSFFEVIKPFDRYMMRLQDYLLRSTTPLLMACNAYELRIKTNSFSNSGKMTTAFQTTMSLCRKSLALLGQTFALASAFRQEKILEALSVQDSAPPPTLFPNFDTSALFGKEYIETLQSWLEKSGCKMQLKRPAASPPAQAPQRADRKVVETIEKLVNAMVSGVLTGKEKAELKHNPEYWFLLEEESLEYKYYKLKLDETERLMSAAKEEETKDKKTSEQQISEAVRILLYRRKVARIKKKLFQRRRPGILQRAARARRAKKSTTGTQTLLSAGSVLKQQTTHTPMSSPNSDKSSGDEAEALPLKETSRKTDSLTLSENSPSLMSQFPDVDPKVMVTAQKLAEFVAEVGPEIEQFSIDNSADNPDLLFLQDPESSAFKFYRMKVHELCPSISFSGGQESGDLRERSEPKESEWENLEEEEEEEEDEEEEAPQAEMEDEEGDEEEEATGPTEEPEEAMLEEGLMKLDHSKTAEEEGETSSTAAGALSEPPAQATTHGAPFGRKRISSKSLKVGLIPASKRVCLIDEPTVHDPVRISYDRPRGYPAYKNKKKTKDLEFYNKRLNEKNIGFQILQKMGWQEGRGLGLHGKGIQEPVDVGSTSAGEGLGVAGKNKEDTFATFRQRMIQMYYMKRANK